MEGFIIIQIILTNNYKMVDLFYLKHILYNYQSHSSMNCIYMNNLNNFYFNNLLDYRQTLYELFNYYK